MKNEKEEKIKEKIGNKANNKFESENKKDQDKESHFTISFHPFCFRL